MKQDVKSFEIASLNKETQCFLWKVSVGDSVHDDLTGKTHKVIRLKHDTQRNNVGIWLDSEYLDGERHAWEISKL
jgi:hypothetical protein